MEDGLHTVQKDKGKGTFERRVLAGGLEEDENPILSPVGAAHGEVKRKERRRENLVGEEREKGRETETETETETERVAGARFPVKLTSNHIGRHNCHPFLFPESLSQIPTRIHTPIKQR